MSVAYNVKWKVLGAFRHLMVPLVRVLIRNGVGVHEFTQVVKEVYTKVCIRDFCPPTHDGRIARSRIAVITGLTRSEVARLVSDNGELRRAIDADSGLIANLLTGWHTDADFVGPYGVPRDLFLDKDPLGLETFTELVNRYGSGSTRAAVLEELVKIDAVIVPPTGEPLRVIKRTYIPESMAPSAVDLFARGVRRFSETVDHNLENAESDDRIFERWVFPDEGILERDWETFHALVSERLQELVRELDTKFSWFESPQTRGEEGISVGVGVYVYRDSHDDQRDWEQMLGYPPRKNQ
jgi:hypothetical protein